MHNTYTHSDLRKFGLILGGLFVGIFGLLLPSLGHHQIPTWPWVIAGILWAPATLYPRALTYVYKLWMKFGDIMGFINTRIILGILFFLVIWPIGLVKRTFGSDVMGKHYDKQAKTYRTKSKVKDAKHMEKPF